MEIEKMITKYDIPVPSNRDEFMKRVDEYFTVCKGEPLLDEQGFRVLDRFGNPAMINKKIPTVSGLALALGLKTRKKLIGYAKNGQFSDLAQIALTMLEEYAEMRLYDKNGQKGAVFSLCNSFDGWAQLDKDESSKEALEKLDTIIAETKKVAMANGANVIMLNDKEVNIDVENDKMISDEEEDDKDKITEADIESGMIGE